MDEQVKYEFARRVVFQPANAEVLLDLLAGGATDVYGRDEAMNRAVRLVSEAMEKALKNGAGESVPNGSAPNLEVPNGK